LLQSGLEGQGLELFSAALTPIVYILATMKKIHDIPNLSTSVQEARDKYKYQETLTPKLDQHTGDFTEMTLLEIVLWKVNRYPEINNEIIRDINDLRKSYTEHKAKTLLLKLLHLKGFDLPMASTVLRFAVPHELQIIDQRVYRFITDKNKLEIPYNIDKKVELYFDYIEQLKNNCNQFGITFSESDRILYQIDKIVNKDVKLKTS
jgi:thermostable 8-oxoguanine DNA glycosylase